MESMIGGEHHYGIGRSRQTHVGPENLVDVAEVELGYLVIAFVILFADLWLFRRREGGEDVSNRVGPLKIDDRQIRHAR